jgi:hypothetical protein
MKLKIFWGCAKDVVDQFNAWAKGKVLNKEVIIHEHCFKTVPPEPSVIVMLFVYYPELPQWDETPKQLTAPIHNVPVPHIKIEEIKVTQ